MSKSPAFQFYPSDYLASQKVELMSLEQQGAYVRLLCHDWLNDGIPDDKGTILKLCRMDDKGGYELLRACFDQHPTKAGFLSNPRLQSERSKQAEWRRKSSEGGQKSAAKRWGKDSYDENKGGYKMVKECLQPNGNSPSPSPSGTYKSMKLKIASLWDVNRKWTHYEESTLAEIARNPDCLKQFEDISHFRDSMPPKDRTRYFPQSVTSLLGKWGEMVDRAHTATKLNGATRATRTATEQAALDAHNAELAAAVELSKPRP